MSTWSSRLFGAAPASGSAAATSSSTTSSSTPSSSSVVVAGSSQPLVFPLVRRPQLFEAPRVVPTATTATSATSATSTLAASTAIPDGNNSGGGAGASLDSTIRHVILDTAVFMSSTLSLSSSLGPNCTYLTVAQVEDEIKDEASRHRYRTFPYPIIKRQPSADAVNFVVEFARATGDLSSLSATDLLVLALAYMVETEQHGRTHLRSAPARLDDKLFQLAIQQQSRAGKPAAASSPTASSASKAGAGAATSTASPESNGASDSADVPVEENGDEQDEDDDGVLLVDSAASLSLEDQDADDAAEADAPASSSSSSSSTSSSTPSPSSPPSTTMTTTTTTETAPRTTATVSSTSSSTAAPAAAPTPAVRPAVTERAAFSTSPNEEGEWITPQNIGTFVAEQRSKRKRGIPKSESSVACSTSDYAMQNVLFQIGLRLLSINGMAIRSIRQWLKKCHGCFAITRDMEREFCPACGNHTMIRVTVQVDEAPSHPDGVRIRMWHGMRHMNKRGTVYSIPRPKGGRRNQDLLLAEDVMPSFTRKPYGNKGKTSAEQMFLEAAEFGRRRGNDASRNDQFGFGKKNPNASFRRR